MEIKLRHVEPRRRQRFAIMVTKEAHALEALLAACRMGRIKADSALVVSNRAELRPLARQHKLPFVLVDWNDRAGGGAAGPGSAGRNGRSISWCWRGS